MIFTNNSNLPQPLVDAVTNDPYSGNIGADISVTRLIQPPRKVALEKLHDKEIVEDAADRLWALLGQIGHLILERAASKNIVERRFFAPLAGWTVSGQADIVNLDTILDYKFTSVWTAKDGIKQEWVEQVNLLALLARANSFEITKGQIVCIFRDWSTLEAKRDSSYPQQQVLVLDVPMWEKEALDKFATERINLHQSAQQKVLPNCTAAERWERGAKWAVMKKGRKSAIKLHENPDDAQQQADSAGNGHYVEVRPPTQVRCENYCAAAQFCDQFKAMSKSISDTENPV